MYRVFAFLFLLLPLIAQALEVQITEIAPHKVNEEEEWFEFVVSGVDEVDMTGWKIQNAKGTTKAFEDFLDRIELGTGITYEQDVWNIAGEKGFVSWTKSPLSLPNDGGSIILLDENDVVLDSIAYPKTKSGTIGGVKYAEIWNRDEDGELVPLIFRDDPESAFTHTKGAQNHLLPTLPDDLQILISEVNPQRVDEPDFVELYVLSSSSDPVNLKYFTLKHNGTKLWEVEHDLLVSPGDYIVVHANDIQEDFVRSSGKIEKYTTALSGLSAGSGTIELILFAGTSLEATVDFLCYQDEVLSQTESARVAKNIQAGYWIDECVEISEQIKNESVARNTDFGDSNTKSDWIRHFHGSPGEENILQNEAPVPVIRVQGSGKTAGTLPFSLNLTGEDSTDPDGDHDLKSFLWTINDEVFAEQENPLNYKIPIPGEYEVVLTVTDYSGATASQSLQVQTWDAGASSSGGFGETQEIKYFFETQKEESQAQSSGDKSFFADFIMQASAKFWTTLRAPSIPTIVSIRVYHSKLTFRQKLQFYHPTKTITRNNLGMIFMER